ncbi:Uncharacterised protein [Enterobacter hormaechei]|nr:hypothetical protein [Enterobacter hormaechei]SAH82093.1 Uncharacterised protein [Enterobacter hormaechei]
MRNKANLLFIAVIAIPFYSFSSTTLGMKSGPGIQTKMLASMARVSEAELVYAIKHTGELHGVKIPEPMQARGNAKTRNFDYLQCVAFVEELEKARVNENVRKSVGKGK